MRVLSKKSKKLGLVHSTRDCLVVWWFLEVGRMMMNRRNQLVVFVLLLLFSVSLQFFQLLDQKLEVYLNENFFTNSNLSSRSLEVNSILFPICDKVVEIVNLLFLVRNMAHNSIAWWLDGVIFRLLIFFLRGINDIGLFLCTWLTCVRNSWRWCSIPCGGLFGVFVIHFCLKLLSLKTVYCLLFDKVVFQSYIWAI